MMNLSRASRLWWTAGRSMHGSSKIEFLKEKFADSNINWFPGHMQSATNVIEKRIRAADLVLEVRDARVPLSSACNKLDPLLVNRKRLIVLNKSDMLGPEDKKRWREYFLSRNQPIHFTDATNTKGIEELLPPALAQSGIVGLKEKRAFIAMIIGIPNTGKSTLINAMRRWGFKKNGSTRSNSNPTGARPGLTRHVSVIQFYDDPAAYLIDTPGVMNPKRDSGEAVLRLALTGAIKDSLFDTHDVIEYLLYMLNARKQHAYVEKFGLASPTDAVDELLQAVGVRMGYVMSRRSAEAAGLVSHGEVLDSAAIDVHRSAKTLLRMFRTGDLGRFALDDYGTP